MSNRNRLIVAVIVALVVGVVVGKWVLPGHSMPDIHDHAAADSSAPSKAQIWTCSMHPQIQQPGPGKCPLCGMDLIPVSTGGDDVGPRELRLSESARMLARIGVSPVRRQVVTRDVRMVGSVTYDETRLATITARVDGRLDRLYVDYTGITVNPGDHMVWMYSPDIFAAQEELLQAKRAITALQQSPSAALRESAQKTLEATRERLRLWGLTADQIAEIEARGSASDHIQINAPVGGVVVHKAAQEGTYVTVGSPIYQIADLSQVWVKLEAYESDLSWLRYGQRVDFTTEAYPGENFSGRIAFIDPVLTERTRTVKIRVNVPNESGVLKPGMFVRAAVHAELGANGHVIDMDLAGKWISPMHPEFVSDGPGDCPVCGMPLEKAENLGYVDVVKGDGILPLVVPRSAVLFTGRRSVVYVQAPDDASLFAGREIVLGPRAGDFYIVNSGLTEGELVVTAGAFKIDSALQIQAKPSMMSAPDAMATTMPDDAPQPVNAPSAFLRQLGPLMQHYATVQVALSLDKLPEAQAAAAAFSEALASVDMSLLEGVAHRAWMDASGTLRETSTGLRGAATIDAARAEFAGLSTAMIGLARRFGSGLDMTLYVAHCPMAFDNQGADWLQGTERIANPYFGSAMLTCGEITDTLQPAVVASPTFASQVDQVVEAYMALQQALSADDQAAAVKAAAALDGRVGAVDATSLDAAAGAAWRRFAGDLRDDLAGIVYSEGIAGSRESFLPVSATMIALVAQYKEQLHGPLYRVHCPMAFDGVGGDWLQRGTTVSNPYYGASMLRCGDVTATLVQPATDGHDGHDHE